MHTECPITTKQIKEKFDTGAKLSTEDIKAIRNAKPPTPQAIVANLVRKSLLSTEEAQILTIAINPPPKSLIQNKKRPIMEKKEHIEPCKSKIKMDFVAEFSNIPQPIYPCDHVDCEEEAKFFIGTYLFCSAHHEIAKPLIPDFLNGKTKNQSSGLTTRQKEQIDELIYDNEKQAKILTEKGRHPAATMIFDQISAYQKMATMLGYTPFTVHNGKEWLTPRRR